MAPDPELALSMALRRHTSAAHREAESGGVVRRMLEGTVTRAQYVLWLSALLPVYAVLEAALAGARPGTPAHVFADPRLHRVAALRGDLDALGGAACLPDAALAASRAYVSHIELAAREDPPALVGHAYVRYLGDLSGGQLLSGLLAKHLGLTIHTLAHYRFDGITDLDACKAGLRAGLDGLTVTPAERRSVLAAADTGFRDSMRLSLAVADVRTG